jgi:hypothetical protein
MTVFAVDQVHDAGLLAGPRVVPAAAKRVLAARRELVEVFKAQTQIAF